VQEEAAEGAEELQQHAHQPKLAKNITQLENAEKT